MRKTINKHFGTVVMTLLAAMLLFPKSLWALSGSGTSDDPCLIYTKDDLSAFCNRVNNGENMLCARLCASLNLSEYNWTPIGQCNLTAKTGVAYSGTFDGNGNSLSDITIQNRGTMEYGLFSCLNGGTVKNLFIHNISVSGNGDSNYGTVCGSNYRGSIQNVCVYGTVTFYGTTTGKIGGITGSLQDGAKLQDCFTTYTSLYGAMSADSHIYNFNAGDISDGILTDEDVSNGHLCYVWNNGMTDLIWRQNINVGVPDEHPVTTATHGGIYAGEEACPNTLKYSNKTHAFKYEDGVSKCSNEGCAAEGYEMPDKDTDGYFKIYNKGHLHWFVDNINSSKLQGNNQNARLMKDIDFSDYNVMIGKQGVYYTGIFDGQYHTITLNYNSSEQSAALFRSVVGATIKNLVTAGTVTSTALYAAGIVGSAYRLTMTNCMSFATINSGGGTNYRNGGLIGSVNNLTMKNCAFMGLFKGEYDGVMGGLIGFNGSASVNDCQIVGCYTGNVFDYEGSKPGTLSYTIAPGASKCTSCFYHENLASTMFKQGEAFKDWQMEEGDLCFLLNGSNVNGGWYQNLNEDKYPVPFYTHRKVFEKEEDNLSIYYNRNFVQLTAETAFQTGYNPAERAKGENEQENKILTYVTLENQGENLSNDGTAAYNSDYNVYTYTNDEGTLVVDNIPRTTSNVTKVLSPFPSEALYVKGNGRLYEYDIMENSITVHNFLPGKFNGKFGFYDTVDNSFTDIDGVTGFIGDCEHKYIKKERVNGIERSHCYICDQIVNTTYFVDGSYDANGGTGEMGTEEILPGAKLKKNIFHRQMYVFNGWKAYKDGKEINNIVYGDEAAPEINADFCGDITFRAQWAPCFIVGKDTVRIPDSGVVTDEIVIVDDKVNGFSAAQEFTASSIKYIRTVEAQKHWGSLSLPFPVSEGNITVSYDDNAKASSETVSLYTDGKISAGASADREKITFSHTSSVDAAVPCMYYVNGNGTQKRTITITAKNVTVKPAPQDVTTSGGLTFTGTFQGTSFQCETDKYSYYGVLDDVFYNVGTTYVVHPFRMYMTMPVTSGAKAKDFYDIDFEENPTAITSIKGDASANGTKADEAADGDNQALTQRGSGEGPTYNLSGQKVSRNYHGVVIKNGKKILNR